MGEWTMSFRYRAVAALMLATCVASCSDSNPFVGKWEAANNSNPDTCAKSIEVTDKSYRSDQGIWLYTLVEDGDDYIIDRNHADKIQATVAPDNTVTLNFGPYRCKMQRQKDK
jgi:hypothetical protein